MEDFLKNRPVVSPPAAEGAAVPARAPAAQAVSAFGELKRPATAATAVPVGKSAAPVAVGKGPVVVDAQNLNGDNGARVQTVVERGRVVKIIVTCACGKVTEIACQY